MTQYVNEYIKLVLNGDQDYNINIPSLEYPYVKEQYDDLLSHADKQGWNVIFSNWNHHVKNMSLLFQKDNVSYKRLLTITLNQKNVILGATATNRGNKPLENDCDGDFICCLLAIKKNLI